MKQERENSFTDSGALCESLNAKWRELCGRYLPIAPPGSIWRYSRESYSDDPGQGWKLHLAASVLTAAEALQRVAPFLRCRNALYKAPVALDELGKLNSGIHYGYSQVGKFLTIYPRTNREALQLARKLHKLTCRMAAPSVPFDLRYRSDSCIFYRYGAFRPLDNGDQDDERTHVIRDPSGNLVPDIRNSEKPPTWALDPFVRNGAHATANTNARSAITPLQTTYKAFRALAQRGKGGVYQAVDLSTAPPRLCVLKEGRRNGETSWDARDGFWRVRYEKQVLTSLLNAGIKVPAMYSAFQTESNYFVALEFIEGENIEKYLLRRERKLTIAAALKRSIQAALLLSGIHKAGWVWRDCKPRNLILTDKGELRPIDFEGACRIDRPDPEPWGTPAYAPPEWDAEFRGQSRLPEDLYSLGVLIHILFTGRPPKTSPAPRIGMLRRHVPDGVSALVAELHDPDPHRRPCAESVVERLRLELDALPCLHPQTRLSLRRARR